MTEMYAVALALIAGIPAYFAFMRGKRADDEVANVRVYTVYDKLLEREQADNTDLRRRLAEAEESLRECLNEARQGS